MARNRQAARPKVVSVKKVLAIVDNERSKAGPIGLTGWDLIKRLERLCGRRSPPPRMSKTRLQ